MTPTTDDLREALSRAARPTPAGTERLVGVRRVIARRRRARVVGSAVLTLLVAAGVFGVAGPAQRQAETPATPLVSGLPIYHQGGRLIGQAQLSAKVGDERTFDITPTSFELMTMSACSPATADSVDVITEVNGKVVSSGACDGEASGPFEDGGRLWKRYGIAVGRPATVTVKIGSIDLPPGVRNADSAAITVRVGFYQAVAAEQFPLPPHPATVAPPTGGFASSSTPRRDVVKIEPGTQPVGDFSRVVAYHADLIAESRAWAPGLVRLLVNGQAVTGAATWTYTANAASLDLSPATLRDAGIAVPKDGEPITLTVQTERFQDPAWQVQVGRP